MIVNCRTQKFSLNFCAADLIQFITDNEQLVCPIFFQIPNSFPMESQSSLDTNGDLRINSLAELIAEIAQNKLDGSLRTTNADQKIAVYFVDGELVFAVSNARQHRLFEILLQAGRITKDQLTAIPEFTNDLALKENLLKNNLFEKAEINDFFSGQIYAIIENALVWQVGEWTFSPLVKIKSDIRFGINLLKLLIEHARSLPPEEVVRRIADPRESFKVKADLPADISLSPHESFVFSRFEAAAMTIEEVQNLSGLPEAETRRILYVLWLGGWLTRENWNAAFSERKVSAILSARLHLKKNEPLPVQIPNGKIDESPSKTKPETVAEVVIEKEKTAEPQISLAEYLDRVEQATNFYELFGLAPDSVITEIKQTYFGLAKRFHPDLFHKEEDTKLLQKIQSSFTRLAQAYDTLKTENSREVYDFRMRKELAEMKAVQAKETTTDDIKTQKEVDQAAEHFDLGFGFLMDENITAALPFLARAVHFDGTNARYHAYYGKALTANPKQRHKAESELQAAIKLDSENAIYRMMLAEFFAQFKLFRRAEGELKRLLTLQPNNTEARMLLDSLPKK